MNFLTSIYKFVISLLKEHSSFALIVLGALITFVSNILFERYFNSYEYGEYSIFITYLLYIYSFGFLGLEQVMVRITSATTFSKLEISKYLFTLLIIVGAVFSIASSYFFNEYFFEANAFLLEIITITIAVLYSQLFYNLYRLKSKFVFSQLFATFWKLPLGVLILFFYFNQKGTFETVFNLFFYFSIFLILFYTIKLFSFFSFKKESDKKKIFSFWVYFLLAIGSITLITFFDRFFIKREFGNVAIGAYFYLANLFLFPFGLFQNYLGFKQLILYKEKYTWLFFLAQLKKGFLSSLLLAICLFVFCYALSKIGVVQIQFEESYAVILLFLILGTIKVCYSLASSAVGARISIDSFKKINISTIVATFILFGLFYPFLKIDITIVVIFITVLWGLRLLIYLYFLRKE